MSCPTRAQLRRYAPLNRAFAAMCKRVEVAVASPSNSLAGYEVWGGTYRDGKTYTLTWFVSDLRIMKQAKVP
jgi:hypothetical protein